jgi:hypothetical protein
MHWRSLLGTVAAVVLSGGFTACSLATGGLAPDPTGSGEPTGSGGAGGGQGGAGSGSSSSSSGAGESCLNCADPACSDQVACEKLPSEWKVVFVKDADPSQSAGKCADGSTGALYFTGPAGAPTCSPCGCTVDPAATCNAPEISCWYNRTDCGGKEDTKTQPDTDKACVNFNGVPSMGLNFSGSCKFTKAAHVLNPGTCSYQGGTNTTPSPWSGAKLVCPTAAGEAGCAAGQRCAPKGPAADGASCVIRPGNDPCPPGFPTATSAFSGVGNDTRSCGTCSCTVGCTGGNYSVHDNNDCGPADPEDIIINTTTCTTTPSLYDDATASARATVAQAAVATCSNGTPGGKVDGTGPQRICCR